MRWRFAWCSSYQPNSLQTVCHQWLCLCQNAAAINNTSALRSAIVWQTAATIDQNFAEDAQVSLNASSPEPYNVRSCSFICRSTRNFNSITKSGCLLDFYSMSFFQNMAAAFDVVGWPTASTSQQIILETYFITSLCITVCLRALRWLVLPHAIDCQQIE